jgi:hypothetical protein
MILKIFSAKILAKIPAFFSNCCYILQKFDHNFGFWEKRQYFRRKLAQIADNCDDMYIDPWSRFDKLVSAVIYGQNQGCQTVCYIRTKNANLGKFWRVLQWKMPVHFMAIWSILLPFGIFCCHLVYFTYVWTGNPGQNWINVNIAFTAF